MTPITMARPTTVRTMLPLEECPLPIELDEDVDVGRSRGVFSPWSVVDVVDVPAPNAHAGATRRNAVAAVAALRKEGIDIRWMESGGTTPSGSRSVRWRLEALKCLFPMPTING